MRLVLPINDMNKARSVKYIRRWPKSTGKGWNYLYPEDFLHPFKFLKEVLGVQEKKIESDYEKNNISKDFGVDKKTFAAHALEYLTNRTTWDNFFTKKENREKFKKPVRQSTLTKDKQEQNIGQENQPDLFKKEEKKDSGKIKLNRSLMKRVWSIYNPNAKELEKQDDKKPVEASIKPVKNESKKVEAITQEELNTVKTLLPRFVGNEQYQAISGILRSGETGDKNYYKGRLKAIAGAFNKIKKNWYTSYDEDKKKHRAGIHLFDANSDFYITEWDGKDEAFGYVILNGDKINAEWGYIDLKRLVSSHKSPWNQLEIDLHYDNTGFVEDHLEGKQDRDSKPNSPIKNEAEEHQNRSQAMMGNQNAKKFGMPDDVYMVMRNLVSEEVNDRGVKNRKLLFDKLYKKNDYFRQKLDKYGGESNAQLTGYNRSDIFNALYDDVAGGNNDAGTERDGLSAGAENLRSGGSQGIGGENVYSSESGANGIEFVQQPRDTGVGAGGYESEYRQSTGRVTKGKAKAIRQQCRELLDSKTNAEMTEADKEILRQYEGAGGLGEGNQSNAAVLSEFYTPRDVISKVWELVDKYKPVKSKVLEPSSGIGRFAEGRSEKFTLCELDETSARIAEILHPEATVKQGAFQNLFMKNNAVQKNYTGEKYDVAVGNPPYGEYTGIYKGIGEGKIHTRYEEYFIDRTLDTLEDGGILAFVVPSGFLRGKTSKAKEAIAAKGKLMEAWRLPKGTFSSTDVGTDIIIVKKGKGDIKDFTDNRYFVENESHVIGHETDGGNWGTKIINLPEGKTVSEAIQMIDVSAVNVENDVKEAVKKIETNVNQEITKKFAIIGDIAVGAKIKTKDGRDGEITNITDKGLIAYKVDGGGFGRLPVSDFDVFADKKTEAELHQIRSEAMKGNQNAKKAFHKTREKKAAKGDVFTPSTGENMSADAFNKLYAKSIPEEDLKFWRATEWDGKINVSKLNEEEKAELVKNQRFLNIDNSYISVANYASGNIYEKLEALEDEKNSLSEDEYQKRKGILEKAMPAKKSVDNFTISPIANFAKTFTIDGETLVDKFLKYCRFNRNGNAMTDSPISEYDLDEYVTMRDVWDYIHQTPVRAERARSAEDKETEKMIAEKKRQNRKDTSERLFNRWLRTLPKEETKALEEAWNQRFNAFVNPDFEQIPLYVDGMNENKGSKKFVMTKQQIKGASELCNKGNGILAYDVGVGKTVTGIVATVSQVQTGQAKRPLICVPKAVYKKWIKEFKQHFPNEPINELGNFSEKDLGKFKDKEGKVNLPERAVNICTYEALQKITFKPETLEGDLRDDIMDSQSIHDYDEYGNLVEDTRTDREKAKQEERVMKMLGISASAKEGAVFWEDLGIDHITVDELHNFKNIFSIPRTIGRSQRFTQEKKRDIWGRVKQGDSTPQLANEYSGIAGASSSRGMKLFAISQLIQRENNGRGFFGLSATPFNNSPVEIYNILSLVARNRLKDLEIYNLSDFMNEFAEMKNDWKVKANGEVESAQVMKNFKNLGALQSLITEFIDKVDGEEAGVIRPYKRVHKPELDLTPLQKAIINAETDRMNGKFRKSGTKDDTADTLIAMNNMRMATLSPSLIDPKFFADYEEYEGWHKPTLQNIVKESPKLQFVCDTATQQYKARPEEGQVIYMPRGVEQYSYVKDYLVSQGIPADAVAFMDSSISLDKKEQITESFNDPDGKIKIIIGSETIKEGVSLNGNSTTIYNTMLGWNPTETIQVEGRIWRQGNKQGVTHIVYPLMNDSIDSMMYQKYDEKSSRLNALWSYKGDSLNVEDINPEELKFALIKDPEKRAKMRINQQQAELKRSLRMINAEYDNLGTMAQELRKAKKGIEEWEDSVDTYSSAYSAKKAEYQKAKEDLKAAEKALKKNPDDAELKTEEQRAKIVLSRMEFNLRNIEDALKGAKATFNSHKGTLERLDKQFTRMGVKPEASDAKLKELSAQREMIKQEIDSIEKQRAVYIEQARQDIAAEQAAQRHFTVQDRVDYYTAEIAGDLRPFAGVKSGIQQLRELGKTDIEQVISDIKQSGSARIGDDVFTTKDIRDLESYAKKAVKKSLVISGGRFYLV